MELKELLDQVLTKKLTQIILSNTSNQEFATKIKIRPILVKDRLLFQETIYRNNQVYHTNYTKDEIEALLFEYLNEKFKQCEISCFDLQATVLVSKKGKTTIRKKKRLTAETQEFLHLQHNKEKNYILKEENIAEFLVGLNVQTRDGKIAKNKYDKFRQINRYLEFIEDIVETLPKEEVIRIVDFGCGKSYLTFAMYHYFHEIKKRKVEIIGLDLKVDVIAYCNKLAKECNYHNLTFQVGDISTYQDENKIDMVVSLHACDTATDYALEKAVKWNAKVIFAVPCCQHEVNKQIKNELLSPFLKYGILKERISSLITDGIRANILEEQGYDTQILEFIDMEHTPKNLLIRAVKRTSPEKIKMDTKQNQKQNQKQNFDETLKSLNLEPTLRKLL